VPLHPCASRGAASPTRSYRWLSAVGSADWLGFPDFHHPDFKWSAIILVLPAVIALIAENTGHVKPESTDDHGW
jgi:xanthine/uracil permease